MAATVQSILADLAAVERERQRRATDAQLGETVAAVKQYQQRRFAHTYADLLLSVTYGPAARFFLDELYGPRDFSRRDAQFARVVPAMVRLFPGEIVDTVGALGALHALSESLDTVMAESLRGDPIDAMHYCRAWQKAGRAADRELQISLTLEIGEDLDRLTRKALVRHSLRLMRGPAAAAGLEELQRFLERGFDTFKAMGGARPFLDTVAGRERALAAGLFSAQGLAGGDPSGEALTSLLGQLP